MQLYRTKTHDVLDAIISVAYGQCNDAMLAAVYAVNEGLAEYGAVLPAGVLIALPDTLQPTQDEDTKGVSLWD